MLDTELGDRAVIDGFGWIVAVGEYGLDVVTGLQQHFDADAAELTIGKYDRFYGTSPIARWRRV